MSRVILTGVLAFAVLVAGYHHFAQASGQSVGGSSVNVLPGGGSVATVSSGTGSALKGLSASQARQLTVDQAQWQADFNEFMQATLQCPVQYAGVIGKHPSLKSCVAPSYRKWSASFTRFQRKVASDMHSVGSTCGSVLAESAGLKGPGAKLRPSMRKLLAATERNGGFGDQAGANSDGGRAIEAEGAMVKAALLLSSACN